MKRLHPAVLPIAALFMMIILAGCGGPNLMDRVSGGMSFGICGTIILVLDILVLIQIAGTNWKFGRKALWALIILFFPVGGLILWWIFGK